MISVWKLTLNFKILFNMPFEHLLIFLFYFSSLLQLRLPESSPLGLLRVSLSLKLLLLHSPVKEAFVSQVHRGLMKN